MSFVKIFIILYSTNLFQLETKLKEVRDKKKKKEANGSDTSYGTNQNNNNFNSLFEKPNPKTLCDNLLQNVDVKLKINGISAIGDADVQLKYGNSGMIPIFYI